jgi:hypothetical protein
MGGEYLRFFAQGLQATQLKAAINQASNTERFQASANLKYRIKENEVRPSKKI